MLRFLESCQFQKYPLKRYVEMDHAIGAIGRASSLEAHFRHVFPGSTLELVLLDVFIIDPGTKSRNKKSGITEMEPSEDM